MRLLQKFYALISRGEPADPNEPVELIVVRAESGPITVARLVDDGFEATGHEAFSIATDVASDYRILVPRREVERATERLKSIL